MASSRHSRISAFEAYTSSSSKSKDKSRRLSRSGSLRYNSGDDDDGTEASLKSLLSISTDSKSHSRGRTSKSHGALSLMDIDFGESASGGSSRHSQRRRRHDRPDDSSSYFQKDDCYERNWKKRSDNQQSDSDEDRGGKYHSHSSTKSSSGRREWRESSSSQSHNAPLIVDIGRNAEERRAHKRWNESKSLLGAYVPGQKQSTMSLYEMPPVDAARSKASSYSRSPDKGSVPARGRGMHQHNDSGSEDGEGTAGKKRRRILSTKPQSQSSHISPNRLTVFSGSRSTVVVVPTCLPCLALHGKVKVTCLLGTVAVLGWTLTKSKSYNVYSPHTGALLTLSVLEDVTFSCDHVTEELARLDLPENDIKLERFSDQTGVVLLLEKVDSVPCDYVTTFTPYTQLFNPVPPREEGQPQVSQRGVTLTKLGVKVAPPDEMAPNCLTMSVDYQSVLDKWMGKLSAQDGKAPVVLCCGAKNCGKSTFNRILINSTLQRLGTVAYLEMDIGQTEFSPPATLSLHIIRDPVLGPPFCHQKHAERLVFYGDVTPSTDPGLYLQCLASLVQAYRELFPSVPLVVNSMGFTEGLGIMLLVDSVRLVKPDLVVQIDSYNQAANLPAVTQEMVALHPGWADVYQTAVLTIFLLLHPHPRPSSPHPRP